MEILGPVGYVCPPAHMGLLCISGPTACRPKLRIFEVVL